MFFFFFLGGGGRGGGLSGFCKEALLFGMWFGWYTVDIVMIRILETW